MCYHKVFVLNTRWYLYMFYHPVKVESLFCMSIGNFLACWCRFDCSLRLMLSIRWYLDEIKNMINLNRLIEFSKRLAVDSLKVTLFESLSSFPILFKSTASIKNRRRTLAALFIRKKLISFIASTCERSHIVQTFMLTPIQRFTATLVNV